MKNRILSLVVVLSMLLSMLGVVAPVFGVEPDPTGQTFFITSDAKLAIAPPAAGTAPMFAGSLTLGVYNGANPVYAEANVVYPAGNWTVFLPLQSNFTGSATFKIGRSAPNDGGTTYYATQVINVTNQNPISFTMAVPSFTIPGPNQFGNLLVEISAMSAPWTVVTGNAFVAAPVGSPIFPSGYLPPVEPTWPATPSLTDPVDAGQLSPDIVGVDYVTDDNNIYIRFSANAEFSPLDKGYVVAIDIDNNTATGSPLGPFGPAGTEYRLQGPLFGGTPPTLTKFALPNPINVTGAAVVVGLDNFYFTIPKSSLGADAAEFENGIHIDAVISAGPTMIDQVVGVVGGGGGGTTLPDLTVPSILVHWIETGDETIQYQVEATIVNNSLIEAPASVARFRVDGVLNDAIVEVPALAPTGGSDSFTFTSATITMSDLSDEIIVYADYPGEVEEQSEENNSHYIAVTPDLGWDPKADLVVNEIHAEPLGVPNTYKVHYSIVNASITGAPASHVNLNINGTVVGMTCPPKTLPVIMLDW